MAFSEVELVFLAFIFIYALVFLMLGRNNSTSTARKPKKKRKGKDTRGQKLSKQLEPLRGTYRGPVGHGIA